MIDEPLTGLGRVAAYAPAIGDIFRAIAELISKHSDPKIARGRTAVEVSADLWGVDAALDLWSGR